ncbi:LysR family transcriptional regulator [Pandoraea terrae]|uniref:LysR family transcriptional regulator n=1 Tax=Pandoraea terrae TaxID=1537710 RepID=A0A5E4WSY5_9BURK|nr:LysR family transcriptional regulator [Pandoraea terrae]VVE26096.1 LysR family transcriptional regulator [Pandoraea terrae]
MTELEVVLAVARRSSFRGAALELGMSTTAVSSAVAGLEARLKVRLFNRSTRSVALTDAGRRYVERITPALAEIKSAGDEASTGPGTPSGTLRINAPQGAALLLLEPLVRQYAQRYPEVRIDIVSESRMIDIVAEGFDAGIRLAESVPQDMIAVPLSRDFRMLVVATPEYLERNGQKLQMDLPVRIALNELPAIKQAVLLGLGIGFITEWFITDELKSGALKPVLVPWCPSFGGLRLYYSGHRFVPARLRALIDLVHELRLARRS